MSNWTLFSNHGHVLVCLARDSDARLRDVAADVGITERAVQKIVRDLQESGMVSVTKQGRRNRYRIHRKTKLRHDLEARCTVGGMMKFVNKVAETKMGGAVRSIEPKPVQIQVSAPKPPVAVKAPIEAQVLSPPAAKKEQASTDKPKAEKKPEKQQGFLF